MDKVNVTRQASAIYSTHYGLIQRARPRLRMQVFLPHDRGTISCVAIKTGEENHVFSGANFGKYEYVHGESVNF